jgi:hypothetical protein
MMIVLDTNRMSTLSSTTAEYPFETLIIAISMLLVLGLAVLVLWLRDRWMDWRGVAGWIRERGQIRAQRVAVGYRILWLVCAGIACSKQAFQVSPQTLGFLLLLIAAIAFRLVWGDFKIFQGLSKRIDELNRQNGPQSSV